MEKQKLLWVILSVTIAAIIVILGGLLLLRDETLTAQTDDKSTINYPMSRINAESLALDYTRENYPLSGIEQGAGKDDIVSKDVVIGEAEGGEKHEEVRVLSEDKKEISSKPKEPAAKTQNKTTSYSPPNTTSPSKTKTILAAEYWIQAGSYKERNKAEILNNTLAEKGLPGRILTKEVNGTTYYRVRIGPYPIREEAEKFLIWIKELNGLEKSYISKVTVRKKPAN
jgi:DedD protein